MEEPLNDRLLWEEALLGKIRTMSVLQKNVLLDAVHHYIKEHSQVGPWETRSPLQDIPLPHSRAHWGPHCPLASTGLCVPEAPDLLGCVAEGARRQEGVGAQGKGQVGHRDLTSWCSVPGIQGWAWEPRGARHSLPPPLGLGGCRGQVVSGPPLHLRTSQPVGCRRLPSSDLLQLWGARPCSSLMPCMLWPLSSGG